MTLSDDPEASLPASAAEPEIASAAGEDERLAPPGPPPKVLSPMFWLMIVVGLVCVLAGVAVALVGPRLYPRNEPPIATVPR